VVTDLKHRPESPGFNPEAHHTMMIAVGWRVGPRRDFDSYKIHARHIFLGRFATLQHHIERWGITDYRGRYFCDSCLKPSSRLL
jgi:hypothetical protein